jgi:hypothetical protein
MGTAPLSTSHATVVDWDKGRHYRFYDLRALTDQVPEGADSTVCVIEEDGEVLRHDLYPSKSERKSRYD